MYIFSIVFIFHPNSTCECSFIYLMVQFSEAKVSKPKTICRVNHSGKKIVSDTLEFVCFFKWMNRPFENSPYIGYISVLFVGFFLTVANLWPLLGRKNPSILRVRLTYLRKKVESSRD